MTHASQASQLADNKAVAMAIKINWLRSLSGPSTVKLYRATPKDMEGMKITAAGIRAGIARTTRLAESPMPKYKPNSPQFPVSVQKRSILVIFGVLAVVWLSVCAKSPAFK